MTDKLRDAAQQAEREAFERALAAKPDARFWNAADAMFWAWQARAALAQQGAQAEQEPVPNGATHYQPHQKAYYKRVSATEWYLWSCTGKGWLPSKGTSDSSEWIMLSPIQAPQPAKPAQQDAQAVPPQQDLKILMNRLENQAHRAGELWERCQGKIWPEKESAEFAALRDVKMPQTRAALAARLNAAPTPPAQPNAETVAAMQEARQMATQSVCIECRNADSWGLPDKPVCRSCTSGSAWEPLNRSSVNPNKKRQ